MNKPKKIISKVDLTVTQRNMWKKQAVGRKRERPFTYLQYTKTHTHLVLHKLILA